MFNAVRYSANGFKSAFIQEAAFRQELFVCAILIPAAFFIGKNYLDYLILIGSLILVLICELINSAIEALADTITLEHNVLIGRAKDIGSAAVMLSIIFASATWLLLLLTRF